MLSIADILWCVNVDPLKVEDELTKKGFWLSDQPVDRPQSLIARLGQPGSWQLLTPSEHHAELDQMLREMAWGEEYGNE